MCGIIGIVGHTDVTERLVDGLKRLEYRGYDSSGVAVLDNGTLKRQRAEGKIKGLEAKLEKEHVDGQIGIAHTRWATHGVPNETNSHPHFSGRVGVVHNGIIENFLGIREELSHRTFETETDTEVAAHLVDEYLGQGDKPIDAFSKALKKLKGAYAFGLIIDGHTDQVFCARAGSPLALGVGDGEMYLGSDAMALTQLTSNLIYLEEGDWAVLTPTSYQIYDRDDNKVEREVTIIAGGPAMAEKGNYRHFMLKEMYEQPETIGRTLTNYIDEYRLASDMPAELDFSEIDRVIIIACGTACYAGMVAKYWFEQIAGVAVDVDIASEFRYRKPVLSPKSLFIAVSQSGETADTLAALRYCKEAGVKTAALVNVMTSTMAREADIALPINAGPEIGVASTKAFTSQLTALAALSLAAATSRGAVSEDEQHDLATALIKTPRLVKQALRLDDEIEAMAFEFSKSKSAFYLGRGSQVPIAFEGALKLKEISYIHAEGYAAGELKHGPIALIEDGTPVIVLAPYDELFEKTISNLQEVASRGAYIILVTDENGAKHTGDMADEIIVLPTAHDFVAPIISTIAVQLLAYHTAVHLGTDVDQPRNLAKSVTVE
ncbi:glutamine--fructose-6-phosphate transaminase (isomerizing) [Hellea balneolensis]|uniref:glutamine--fructose-6-phosphate transaminase (isomerizing) n=1 Tax=Hellea balneolensis TaxID=287478 RepID=UPI000403F555|nr:glutamine--fructose-6-phosphate transaminase (isomerizing) [Hellea balneolensis]